MLNAGFKTSGWSEKSLIDQLNKPGFKPIELARFKKTACINQFIKPMHNANANLTENKRTEDFQLQSLLSNYYMIIKCVCFSRFK